MNRLLLSIALLGLCGVAQAAKIHVELVTPSLNESQLDPATGLYKPPTPLTDLASILIEWGTCDGALFGVRQAAITINTTQTGVVLRAAVYPTGLNKVCVRAFALNSGGAMSKSSNVASKNLMPTLGKPVQLGEVMQLTFTNEEKTDG